MVLVGVDVSSAAARALAQPVAELGAAGAAGRRLSAARALAEAAAAANAAAAVAEVFACEAEAKAAAAVAAAADVRALAAATTVWLAFEGIPPPEDVQQILQGNRGVWLPTAWAEEDRLQRAKLRVLADGAEDRWARGPQLALPVVGALKDLGVAQGLGKPAKELQAARARTACDRLKLVARLGLPRKSLSRLTAASGLTAGMFGAASHTYDSDMLGSLRSWVMHAMYRGSRFAQTRLFMHLVLPSPLADPWQVALGKAWKACELVRSEWGEAAFWRVWDNSAVDGPLLSFKRLLAQLPQSAQEALPPQQLAGQPAGQQQQQQLQQAAGQQQPAARRTLEDSYRSGGPEWRSRRVAAALMSRALQAHDLQWVAERRAGLKEVGRLDVGLARRLAGQLPALGMREAFESVLVGDMPCGTKRGIGSSTTAAACAAWARKRSTTSSGTARGTPVTAWEVVAAARRPAGSFTAASGCWGPPATSRSWRSGESPRRPQFG